MKSHIFHKSEGESSHTMFLCICNECKGVQLLCLFASDSRNSCCCHVFQCLKNQTPPFLTAKKKCELFFVLQFKRTVVCVCVHLCDYFISFHKQPQYESTPLQPHISERSASHLEELERKIAAAETKELQLSEIVKQLSNKSSEEKKKMEEKVSVFPDPPFFLSLLQQHIFARKQLDI